MKYYRSIRVKAYSMFYTLIRNVEIEAARGVQEVKIIFQILLDFTNKNSILSFVFQD